MPLGMISGAIDDTQISASSFMAGFKPSFGRLGTERNLSSFNFGAWCALLNDNQAAYFNVIHDLG